MADVIYIVLWIADGEFQCEVFAHEQDAIRSLEDAVEMDDEAVLIRRVVQEDRG